MANTNRNKYNDVKSKMITKSDEDSKPKRESALGFQKHLTFEQMLEIIQRNVTRNVNKTYTQFQKETVRSYLQNPANSLSNIIEISRFLERNSTLYKKILNYYASTPLFYYNLTQENDFSKSINSTKSLKDFYTVSKQINGFNIAKEMYNAIYNTVRDGMYCAFSYSTDETTFLLPLDIKYCRIYGKSNGELVVYFDATYFNGVNSIYIEGVDGNGLGVWDSVFIDGYNAYNEDNTLRWFRLPPERTFCMIAGSDDQFDVPLPMFAPLFISLMDLMDLESLINSKTELENYKLLVSKIPLVNSSDDVDDFSISLDLANFFNAMLEAAVPELVGTVVSPMEIDTVEFNKSNKSDDTDYLSRSMQNLFNNAGVSQIVVAGGASSNSVGLKNALQNDLANIWIYVNRIESWLNYFIKSNISEGYKLQIHKISWFNQEDYQKSMKECATLGGSALSYLTSLGDTPYIALQKLNFENAIGVKNLMIPLNSSYTQSSSNTGGRPQKDETELTDSGVKTRDGNKNEGSKANS